MAKPRSRNLSSPGSGQQQKCTLSARENPLPASPSKFQPADPAFTMGNISSQPHSIQPHSIQPHYVYEQEAHLVTQFLQSPEVRHVVQSLGDFFRHHGDYYKHKRNRHRKKDRWEQDELLLTDGQRQRDDRPDERRRRRDTGDRKRGCCRDHDSHDERCRCKGPRHDPGDRRPRGPSFHPHQQHHKY